MVTPTSNHHHRHAQCHKALKIKANENKQQALQILFVVQGDDEKPIEAAIKGEIVLAAEGEGEEAIRIVPKSKPEAAVEVEIAIVVVQNDHNDPSSSKLLPFLHHDDLDAKIRPSSNKTSQPCKFKTLVAVP